MFFLFFPQRLFHHFSFYHMFGIYVKQKYVRMLKFNITSHINTSKQSVILGSSQAIYLQICRNSYSNCTNYQFQRELWPALRGEKKRCRGCIHNIFPTLLTVDPAFKGFVSHVVCRIRDKNQMWHESSRILISAKQGQVVFSVIIKCFTSSQGPAAVSYCRHQTRSVCLEVLCFCSGQKNTYTTRLDETV